eukprot:COSAG02_NODE_25453_length_658_cov_1.886394_1_plen_123_part_01
MSAGGHEESAVPRIGGPVPEATLARFVVWDSGKVSQTTLKNYARWMRELIAGKLQGVPTGERLNAPAVTEAMKASSAIRFSRDRICALKKFLAFLEQGGDEYEVEQILDEREVDSGEAEYLVS